MVAHDHQRGRLDGSSPADSYRAPRIRLRRRAGRQWRRGAIARERSAMNLENQRVFPVRSEFRRRHEPRIDRALVERGFDGEGRDLAERLVAEQLVVEMGEPCRATRSERPGPSSRHANAVRTPPRAHPDGAAGRSPTAVRTGPVLRTAAGEHWMRVHRAERLQPPSRSCRTRPRAPARRCALGESAGKKGCAKLHPGAAALQVSLA
jgi:hypothetical protein